MHALILGLSLTAGCKPPESKAMREKSGNPLPEGGKVSPFDEPPPSVPVVEDPVVEDPVVATAPEAKADPAPAMQFPLDRVLRNADGRSIVGTILAKRGDEIAFRRQSDGKEFVLSITRLSADDQIELSSFHDESVDRINEISGKQGETAGASVARTDRPREAEWHDDPEKAFKEAKATRLPIYVLFTGSDWCPPCMRLEETIHDTREFQEFANLNLVLLKIDFPRRKSQSNAEKERNQEMADSWGVEGFPTIFLTGGAIGTRTRLKRTGELASYLEMLGRELESF